MSKSQERVMIRDVRIFDGVQDRLTAGHVVVAGERIEAVSATEPDAGDAAVIDGGGRVLMPGLIDAHVHLVGSSNTMLELLTADIGLICANTFAEARRTLERGITTVRDMGGNVIGVKAAIDAGTMPGPRVYPSRAMISQTGGHADFGVVAEPPTALGGRPSIGEEIAFARIADGPDRVLAATREQLRAGASQIKLAAGGGVASLYDPLDSRQFTPDEMRRAVEAAADWGTYVAAHVYTADGVRRAVDAGVRSIEHAHLVDEDTVRYLADHDVWLSTQPFAEHDHSYADPHRAGKNREVCAGTERLFGWAMEHGVKTAFGTDLLFEPAATDRQIDMLTRLARYMSPVDALRMVTSGNAALLGMSGGRDPYGDAPLGVVREGAWADLLVVDGDPTTDLDVLRDHEHNLVVIVKDGRVVKDALPRPAGTPAP